MKGGANSKVASALCRHGLGGMVGQDWRQHISGPGHKARV